jgi:hypothetical protein
MTTEARPRQEHGDPQSRVIVLIAAGIVAMLLLCALAAYLIVRSGGPTRNAPQTEQIAQNTRLESDPADEIARYEREKQTRLHSYGWVDPHHKAAHIPIDVAMQKLAQRSAPPAGKP